VTKAKTPYEHSRQAKYLEKRVLGRRPHKTQAKIAEEAGFINPNMIAMLKAGATTLRSTVWRTWPRLWGGQRLRWLPRRRGGKSHVHRRPGS
jgi:hypothetical protein